MYGLKKAISTPQGLKNMLCDYLIINTAGMKRYAIFLSGSLAAKE